MLLLVYTIEPNCLFHKGAILTQVFDLLIFAFRVKSTYVETYDQELFLKNMPKAIDSRILQESPLLAMAIAAEHLIQVFHTHGSKLEKSAIAADVVEQLGDNDEDKLRDAYVKTFDLVDADGSGFLDKGELMQWMTMCGAELDVSTIVDTLLKEGNLSRDKFATLMSTYATSNRRDYDIGGTIKSSH